MVARIYLFRYMLSAINREGVQKKIVGDLMKTAQILTSGIATGAPEGKDAIVRDAVEAYSDAYFSYVLSNKEIDLVCSATEKMRSSFTNVVIGMIERNLDYLHEVGRDVFQVAMLTSLCALDDVKPNRHNATHRVKAISIVNWSCIQISNGIIRPRPLTLEKEPNNSRRQHEIKEEFWNRIETWQDCPIVYPRSVWGDVERSLEKPVPLEE